MTKDSKKDTPTTVEKYLVFLKGVRSVLKANPKAGITTICASYGVSSALCTVLKEECIIEKDGDNNSRWLVDPPTMALAEFLRQKVLQRSNPNRAKVELPKPHETDIDVKHTEVVMELRKISSLLETLINTWEK